MNTMPAQQGRRNGQARVVVSKEGKLRPWLVKCAFGNSLFGMKSFQDFRRLLADIEEGEGEDGHTYFYNVLKNHSGFRQNAKITYDELLIYDENIVQHLKRINTNQKPPIKLKYYQWLGALFTEAYLDLYFKGPGKLSNEIEESIKKTIKEKLRSIDDPYEHYARFMPDMDDLRKCAYWMATGSGKTYLIHLAYLQFLYYNRGPHRVDFDRILLITPNADLTAQHLREMKKSGIPCTDFDSTVFSGYFQPDTGVIVNVLEITRLIEEKKDAGTRRVDIESFGRKNLVFVDEAHKGAGGDKWKFFRRELAREGFTFEYSATFGQAAASGGSGDEDNLSAFAKTILFDYSYPYFYNDGYGKEYRILNVNKATHENERVLLANLLTYYEQKLVFHDLKTVAMEEYNIADPLWIFVGSKVNVSGNKSDVLTIVRFLHKVLSDRDWVVKTTDEFLRGRSGLKHEITGHDLFDPAFPEQRLRYLREKELTGTIIYNDLLSRIFRCTNPTGLTLVLLKNTDGEIGLRSGDNAFFGDIYVGDAPKFISLVEENEPEIIIDKFDVSSLFRAIDTPESTINLLIGAKKFIEGWDCYRVSSMGLINIGKSEGTEIIQLFGRGIRLRGRENSLKRSTNNTGDRPSDLPLLETLNIFGVDAKYIGYLREFLTIEGVEDYKTEDRQIAIKIRTDYIKDGLLIPQWEKTGFEQNRHFVLTKDLVVPVTVNLLAKVESEDSIYYQGVEADNRPEQACLDLRYLNALDWDSIYFTLLNYKSDKGWKNMVFTKTTLRDIIEDPTFYKLFCADHLINPQSFEQLSKFQDVIILILKKSLQMTYNRQKNKWMMDTIRIERLSENHGNFEFKEFTVKIPEKYPEALKGVDELIQQIELLYSGTKANFISNVYFENHLYQPLLAKISDRIDMISPSPLNEGEEKLVRSIREYIQRNVELFEGKKIYLLRNIPKSGVGFYKNSWFYPDFIMWIVDADRQHIVFLEPHGMVYSAGKDDEKVQLAKEIKTIEQIVNSTSTEITDNIDVLLDSFIISVTDPGKVAENAIYKTKENRKKYHVLSIYQSEFVKELFEFVLT